MVMPWSVCEAVPQATIRAKFRDAMVSIVAPHTPVFS
jgi:hypothetical protein